MPTPISVQGTNPLRRILEHRIQGSDATVSRLSGELENVDTVVSVAFYTGLENVMQLIPADAAPMAERAVRALIMDRVAAMLDEAMDSSHPRTHG